MPSVTQKSSALATLRPNPKTLLTCVLLLLLIAAPVHAQPASYGEAPELAALVATGDLPPVEERLPDNPMVVEPLESIGTYGGTWRVGFIDASGTSQLLMTVGYEHLVRWDPEWTRVIPNVAEAFEANDDATEYTFTLRRGMKWSDGHPFTADDIMFWYEDVLSNAELTPAVPGWFMGGDEPVVVEKLDDYTVVFRFAEPNGLFLQRLATPEGVEPTRYARHYLEQFHASYNPEVDQLVEEAGQADWPSYWTQMAGVGHGGPRWQNPDRPVLTGWVLTQPFGEGTRVVVERNPYYWKVDTEGNQLPYIDRMVAEVVGDTEVLVLRAMAGEIDMQHLRIATQANKPVFFDNMERGNYHFWDGIPASMNTAVILLNLNHKDPVKREIFQNKDFRIGLSHAINRREIIDLVYQSQGEPWQAAPRPESPYYHERLAKQYTEHDVDLANEYLDRAYPERDNQGYRLGPDGNRISFVVEVSTDFRQEWVDVMEMVQMYWREVGVDIQIQNINRSLFNTRLAANEHDAAVKGGDGGSADAIMDPRYYFPFSGASNHAMAWATWYSNPSGAGASTAPEEPPAEVRRQMELYDQLSATADPDEQTRLMTELLDIAAEEFHVMGINLEPFGYGIVNNNLRNVPSVMPIAWLYPTPGPTNPEQYYFDTSGQ